MHPDTSQWRQAGVARQPASPASIDSIRFGAYRAGDEAKILDCIRACFDCEPRLERWHHLYRDNPAGVPIIALARHGHDVVGHLAIVPRRVRAFGRVAVVGHQIDGMTRPDWRRHGIRKELAERARLRVVRCGWLATYGVTNELSTHTALTHERRRSLGPLPLMVRAVRPMDAVRALLPRRLDRARPESSPKAVDCAAATTPSADPRLEAAATSGRAVVWRPPAFDARHTRLFHAAEGIPPIAFVRDADYLTWRYAANAPSPYLHADVGHVDGELAATAVVSIAAVGALRVLFLLEWHWRAGGRGDARCLARDAVALARAAGAHGVAALAMPGTAQRAMLWRLGFVPVPAALLPRTSIVSVRVDGHDQDVSPWTARANWYLTCGDGFIL